MIETTQPDWNLDPSEPIHFWGSISIGSDPLQHKEIKISLVNTTDYNNKQIIDNKTLQTTENGLFSTKFSPIQATSNPRYNIITRHNGKIIDNEGLYYDTHPEHVFIESPRVAVQGESVTISGHLDVANSGSVPITLYGGFGHESTSAVYTNLTTDEDGNFSHTFQIPMDAPDPGALHVHAVTRHNNKIIRDQNLIRIQSFLVSTWLNSSSNDKITYNFEAIETNSGDIVSGIPITVFGQTDASFHTTVFDVGSTRTGPGGEGSISLTTPDSTATYVNKIDLVNTLTDVSEGEISVRGQSGECVSNDRGWILAPLRTLSMVFHKTKSKPENLYVFSIRRVK
jgi:hypothetical protein